MDADSIQALVDNLLCELRARGVRVQVVYTITKGGYVSSFRVDFLGD
jgi:hypothetical protein